MKTQLLNSLLILSISTLIIACKKEKVEAEEPVTATINITEPSMNDTIALNEELHVVGTIVGSAELHGYEIKIINLTSNNELFLYQFHEHLASYNFHEHWVNNVTDTTLVKVKVDVELDHEGNKTEKELSVVCLPN